MAPVRIRLRYVDTVRRMVRAHDEPVPGYLVVAFLAMQRSGESGLARYLG